MIPARPVPLTKQLWLCSLLLLASSLPACAAPRAGQVQASPATTNPAGTPGSWAAAAAANQLRILAEDGTFPARYLVRKVDARGDTTRDTMESRDGAVARLIARNGEPITAAEDAAERRRLEDMLASPSDFAKRHRRNLSAQGYAADLIRQMPRAMLYSYAPGQPQPEGWKSPQVVLDFKPDPNYHPPGMVAGLLTGLEGRLWIDARTQTLTRGEGRITQPVDFGWGMLARIYAGGTVMFEQASTGEGHWLFSHAEQHLHIREMLVKNATQNTTMRVFNVQMLPGMLSYQEAIKMLLDTPLHSPR